MSISPLPAPLPQLTGRRFSFYPAILNIRYNQWMYRRATWSEIVVVNTATGEEACIPRMFLGGASRIDEPVVVVELKRELEWRDGVVRPHRCLVIELPVAANDAANAPHQENPAPVVSIRLEAARELRAGKKDRSRTGDRRARMPDHGRYSASDSDASANKTPFDRARRFTVSGRATITIR